MALVHEAAPASPSLRPSPVFGRAQMPQLGEEDAGAKGKGKGIKAEHKLGTFKGVFMPTCENMWGVIIFLRFYTIAGHAGLGYSLIIITLSFFVALLTGLSLSAIATCGTASPRLASTRAAALLPALLLL
eukprot:scaffold114421_cov51-Phaeocystis_antarctica.AAC.1